MWEEVFHDFPMASKKKMVAELGVTVGDMTQPDDDSSVIIQTKRKERENNDSE